MIEVWLPIPDPRLKGQFEASNVGRIRSTQRTIETKNRWGAVTCTRKPKVLSQTKCKKTGYLSVGVSVDGIKYCFTVHRAVCMAFYGLPNNAYLQCAHLDGTRDNNCVENLRWATAKENQNDRIAHNTHIRGEKVSWSILTEDDVRTIRKERKEGVTLKTLAERYGVQIDTIYKAEKRISWKHIA